MSVCVGLLIACAGGEGHGFNQATRPRKAVNYHCNTHVHRHMCMSDAMVNLQIEEWKSGLKVV